ncbi:MAG: 30S ribosomal protein S8 [Planctomycetota bacterium]|nr:MAG: 30S ribosomal protein S8 [Planctomycetota bacterium]REJ95612.1 MAG: 30S ribosomal protein S8 [Planctomycetota bacterium]REK30056.1 MAG: 30S ribosomal protein S8 [Planctomycetota bacterium]REK37702.1 MAG: 30S ribosomal protein S8 [Planctomycetota bacterium]
MMTDPIADMLTRIRNALQIERPFVDIPASGTKIGVAEALQREGFIWDFEVIEEPPQNTLRVNLKYGPNGERVIQHLRRVSKPGRRVYAGVKDTPTVRQGLGVCIMSTNQGVLSNREAKANNVGGEILCEVW